MSNRDDPSNKLIHALSELSRVLKECGISDVGGVRGTTAYDGTQWSGLAKVVRAPPASGGDRSGKAADVLHCERVGSTPLGGMASIHVDVEDVPNEHASAPNQKLVLDISWNSGRGGGTARVDIDRGGVFTVGAADIVTAVARIIPATDAAFTPGNHKRVEASVCWGGSISPKPALFTSEGITVNPAGTTARIAIPKQAASLMVITDDPANYGTLQARFYRETAFGGAPMATTLNPFANATPIVSGMEFVNFVTTGACVVTPVWILHL